MSIPIIFGKKSGTIRTVSVAECIAQTRKLTLREIIEMKSDVSVQFSGEIDL